MKLHSVRALLVIGVCGCLLSGCGATVSGKLSTLEQDLPTLANVPLATCVGVIQQSQMSLGALATGIVVPPAVAPSPAPVATPPATTTPAPVVTTPTTPPTGIPGTFPTSPTVTPSIRHRVSQRAPLRPGRLLQPIGFFVPP